MPPADTSRPHSALFRREDGSKSSFTDSEELRGTLQRRLRFFLWGFFVINLIQGFGGGWISESMRQRAVEAPLRPGAWTFYVIIAALLFTLALALSPRHPRSVRWLRWCEAVVFGSHSVALIGLHLYDTTTLQGVFELSPIDIALGQTSFWTMTMVMYGVLIPNTARRTLAASTLFSLCSIGADLWVWQQGLLHPSVVPIVFLIKPFSLAWIAIIIWYGSYRYETVARREAAARELGQYTLGRRLGGGGMGEVYLGEHRMLRRPVAIKLISAEQAGSPDAIARFEREAQATARLTHPNTIQLFDYGRSEDGTFYCVMEFLTGETLDAIVREQGPLAPERAVHVLSQLCGALAEAHAQGLVHRDLKPGNVMLGERGGVPDVAKLLDFGLVIQKRAAQTETRLTEVGVMVGTPEYMSPEQCGEDEGGVGPASDLYSLGALAYFVLTGSSPFAGRSPVQMLAAHLYETPEPPSRRTPSVPAALDAVVLRCLAKQPSDRYASAAEVATALQQAVRS